METISVELRGGLIVSAEALELAVALESTGHTMEVRNGQLYVSKNSTLTAEQRTNIKRLLFHLIALTAYEVPI